ncbi:MAG TPA: hypothetical protein VK773_04595 [Acidimicrobiales bacterium]|jgi:hypothetical protein|nr:hypothetical protein [Acidimicrobiales bacterium]
MSHRAKSRNTGKSSGRVTPSKLRRTVVVATDGALAIGAGALGGLFATTTGTASATVPTPGWAATQAPLPTTPDAPAADPSFSTNEVSCAAATFCVAGGTYEGSTTEHGVLEVESGGSWSATEAPLPGNAENGTFSKVESVSCPTDGWCAAVGVYDNTSGREDSFIDVLSGGSWSSIEAPVPPDAQPETSADTFLKSVDCQGAGACVAFGAYKNGAGTSSPVGFFDTLANGNWTPLTAPQPGDAATHQFVVEEQVSCPAITGPCAATANYENGNSREQAEVLTQSANGTWSAEAAPLPNDAATSTSLFSESDDISCATGVCVMGGEYENTGGQDAGLIDRYDGTQWTATTSPEPSNRGTAADQFAVIDGVSCTFDGCVAVGEYEDSATGTRPLINTITSNGSVTATEGPQPADMATGSSTDGYFNNVSCLSLFQCTAVGGYDTTTSSSGVALIDSTTGGAWTNTPAPIPNNAATGSSAESGLNAISCPSRGSCVAGGYYYQPGSNEYGLLENYTPPEGYWTNASDGGVFNYGSATFQGSAGNLKLNKPVVGMAASPGDGGYWEVASDGGIFNYGDAPFYGSAGALKLNKPVVGMAATPDGGGYWLVASDGGIFNYGDAQFYGSTGAMKLNQPIVGMASTPDGRGYWLVASDGGIFNYGDASFFGSRGGQPLNKPIVGMASTASGMGYWLVASDGGIFTYGDAGFSGSAGAIKLNKPIVSMMSTFDGGGYFLVATDGGIFNYGDAGFYGSAGNLVLNKPVVNGAAS